MTSSCSRPDLERLIHDDVEATVDTTIETINAAGLEPSDLVGIYLVGGSSKIPLVAARLWSRTGIRPSVQGDPKTVVALGASGWRQPKPVVTEVLDDRTFESNLAMATRTLFWSGVTHCYGYLTVTPDGGAGSVTFSDEPAAGDLGQVVQAAGERWSERPGYHELSVEKVDWLGHDGVERCFAIEELPGTTWVERYIVVGDRSIVGRAHAALAPRLDAVTFRPQTLAADRFYQFPLSSDLASGDRVHERLELIRAGSDHRVTAESYELDPEWGERRIDAYRSHPSYTSLTQTPTRMLGQSDKTWMLGMVDGIPGQMHSFWSASEAARPLHTRIWIGQAGGGRTRSWRPCPPTRSSTSNSSLPTPPWQEPTRPPRIESGERNAQFDPPRFLPLSPQSQRAAGGERVIAAVHRFSDEVDVVPGLHRRRCRQRSRATGPAGLARSGRAVRAALTRPARHGVEPRLTRQ